MTDKDISQIAQEYLGSIDDEVDESLNEELNGKIEQGEKNTKD